MNPSSSSPPLAQRMVDKLSSWLSIVGAAGILLLMLVIVANVFSRWLFGSGIAGSVEITEVLLAGLVFLGFGHAQRQGAHISTGLLITRMKPRAASWVQAFGLLLVVGILVWLVHATGERAWASVLDGEQRYGLRRVPIWPARIAIAAGLSVMLLSTLITLTQVVRAALGIAPAEPPTGSGGEDILLVPDDPEAPLPGAVLASGAGDLGNSIDDEQGDR